MVADYHYQQGVVIAPDGTLVNSGSGVLKDEPGGTEQQLYDMLANPIDVIPVNALGVFQAFRADIPRGALSFGSVDLPVSSLEAADGAEALLVATAARTAADAAQGQATQALADLQAYIDSHPGGDVDDILTSPAFVAGLDESVGTRIQGALGAPTLSEVLADDPDFPGGLTDRGQRLLQVREAPLTPYRYGATEAGLTVDNTAALAAMFAAATGTNKGEIYLPPGDWVTRGAAGGNLPLVSSLTLRAAGRKLSRLATRAGAQTLFKWNSDISGVRIEDLYLDGGSSDGHIFEPGPTGGINASTFKNLFLNSQVDGKGIWHQDNAGSFIHLTWEECELQRTPGSTVVPFYVRTSGGAANCNLFKQVRANGINNINTPFFYFETTLPQTYLADWQFLGIVGEQNKAGLIHMLGALGVTMIGVLDYDTVGPYVADVLKFDQNAEGLAPRDITLINSGRRGASLNAGVRDIYVSPAGFDVTLISCNPTTTSDPATVVVPPLATMVGMRLPAGRTANVRRAPLRGTVAARRLPLAGYPYPLPNNGSVTLAKDTWRYMPLTTDKPISISNLAVLLITAATGGTATMRFGLFGPAADGTPGTLVYDYSQTLDLTTGAGTEKVTAALAAAERGIPAGDWFIGVAWSGTATANPTLAPLLGGHPSVVGNAVGANQNAYSQAVSGASAPSPAAPSASVAQGVAVWGVLA